MGPPKRKGSVRRQVLDLNAREGSPSRPTWQTKYQNVLPQEEIHQNGDSQSSVPAQNPLSGLLGNYNSDSENEEPMQKHNSSLDAKVEDFLKEIQSISAESSESVQTDGKVAQISQEKMPYPPSATAWQQCFDPSSGYPYYWNTETNEVTWEMPTDLRTAMGNFASKQQCQPKQPQIEPEVKKTVCKYPWQTESDSEDEKVESITPVEPPEKTENEEDKKNKNFISPQLPVLKTPNDCITLAPEDSEGLNESTYETSSLLTHGVQDTGPPGDESFHLQKQSTNNVSVSSNREEAKLQVPHPAGETTSSGQQETESIREDQIPEESIADDVIAQIEKETPPDYEEMPEKFLRSSPVGQTTSGIALIANYGEDSESEDNSVSEKRKSITKVPTKPLFPIEIPQETGKPLFPCIGAEMPKPQAENRPKETLQNESEPFSNIYNSEVDDPTVQKAFKRKKRFEFATTVFGPSTGKAVESKTSKSPEHSVSFPTTQYNLDPNANDHQGFGFNALKAQHETEKKTYKGHGGIQFIKAETLNLSEVKPKPETETEIGSPPKLSSKEPVKDEEIEDAALLLREKVMFLTGGTDSISPIQQMAIELETLVLAWQEGALTPPYLLRWLKEKCSELIRHEKSAAPAGWTCLWDRKSKRYFYRNTATRSIQWDYPNVEEKSKGKEGDVEGAGDEMDICDTPPHSSPSAQEKVTVSDETPATPPPPVISDGSLHASPSSPTLQPPPPPQISFCSGNDSPSARVVKKKKRKAEEITEDDETLGTSESKSESVEVPPLPPMPPPPPPPPDESPPPLPDSPPPLPLDQPLPPGVDEPEYALYRSSKHSYKKTPPDSAAYSAELMMTYSYGLPVQQVVSSNGQPMTMQMQPLEYHTYLHESVANPYIVQSAPTSHVIHCPAKKPKPSLTSELVSFYSDLAMLDNAGDNTGSSAQNVNASPAPAPSKEPPSSTVQPPATVTAQTSLDSIKVAENVTSNGVNVKKKKKTKTGSGLALKKKGVSSLVAKWQQVQQEVRKDFSDDDDDASSTK